MPVVLIDYLFPFAVITIKTFFLIVYVAMLASYYHDTGAPKVKRNSYGVIYRR